MGTGGIAVGGGARDRDSAAQGPAFLPWAGSGQERVSIPSNSATLWIMRTALSLVVWSPSPSGRKAMSAVSSSPASCCPRARRSGGAPAMVPRTTIRVTVPSAAAASSSAGEVAMRDAFCILAPLEFHASVTTTRSCTVPALDTPRCDWTPPQVVTTSFPFAVPASIVACAATISSKRYTWSIGTVALPAATASTNSCNT